MSAEKEIITSPNGGRRKALGERWDLIPGGWQSLSEVAAVSHHGCADHHPPDQWKQLDPETEQSPLSHGIAHAYKSLEFSAGSDERIRQLAKAAWNLLAAIWFEKQVAHYSSKVFAPEFGIPAEAAEPTELNPDPLGVNFLQKLFTHRG